MGESGTFRQLDQKEQKKRWVWVQQEEFVKRNMRQQDNTAGNSP